MAMMASQSGSIYAGASNFTYIETVRYVKKPIAQIKKEIHEKSEYRYYFYVLIHDDLKDFPSTTAFINLLVKFGELTGEKAWIVVPIGDGFKRFQNEISEHKFSQPILNFIQGTPDISVIIHDYPLELYRYYGEDLITPTLLLYFPCINDGYQIYADLFSNLTYYVKGHNDLFSYLNSKNTKDVIDCSKLNFPASNNSFIKSYEEKFNFVYEETIRKLEILAMYSDLSRPSQNNRIKRAINFFSKQPLIDYIRKKTATSSIEISLKYQIIEFIKTGDTEKALEVMEDMALIKDKNDFYNALVLKQNQFNRLKSDNILGIISYEESNNFLNKINNDILNMLKK